MKVIGVIPARYKSTRFPGKPLADICGKPMIYWVYQKICGIKNFDDVFCAIDDYRVQEVCDNYGIKYIMTADNHPEHISRIHEVSQSVKADYYVCVNGDEPLITEDCILPVIPSELHTDAWFSGAMRRLVDPAETIDHDNIKLVISDNNRCLYMSRTAIPFPKGTLSCKYWKYVGVECFNKKALDFFVSTKQGDIEKIEDIDHLRFLENGIELHFKEVQSTSLSVDTPKDLEKVRKIFAECLENSTPPPCFTLER